MIWLQRLASLRLTLWMIAFLLCSVVTIFLSTLFASYWLALPLLLLAVNLVAAIFSNTRFRQTLPLLMFHLALFVLLLLFAAGRLSYLRGWVEITEGENFPGRLSGYQAGPFHNWRLNLVNFKLDHFTIDYAPEIQREATRATILEENDLNTVTKIIVGDHYPLVLSGYRFYTSHNKGFAPTFSWQPLIGDKRVGSIHLPAYPEHEYKQALEWTLPGTKHKLWTQLQFDETILNPDTQSQFHAPASHQVIVRINNKRYQLSPGESIELPDGRLTYSDLKTWMGFTVTSDWTLSWILAAALAAVLSLSWHYWRKFSSRPW